jgi:hypothetical protein
MILTFSSMSVSPAVKNVRPLVIEELVEAHPRVFRGKQPQASPTIPSGWLGLLDEFCLLLEAICNDQELSSLQFRRILEESGCLILDLTFDCELSEPQARTIEARVFALRNRSVFTCCVCGRLVDTLTKPVLCKKHNKSD